MNITKLIVNKRHSAFNVGQKQSAQPEAHLVYLAPEIIVKRKPAKIE